MALKNYLYRSKAADAVLTDEATIVWDYASGNDKTVSISGNRTLSISGFPTGFRHYGVLEVNHSAANTTLTLPGDSSEVVWKKGAGETTYLGFIYNGATFKWFSQGAAAPADSTAPQLQSLIISDSSQSRIVLTYSEALNTGSVPAAGDFAIIAGGSAKAVSSVSVTGNTVLLNFSTPFTSAQQVFLSYTKGTNPIEDAAGNDAANISSATVTNQIGNTTPAAPTAGVVDDSANTFNWTNNPSYTSIADYEYTLDGGTTVQAVTAKPIVVGSVTKATGQVGVRVKAAAGRNVSAWLFNQTAFTASSGILANFNGSSGVLLSAYVPESGGVYAITGNPTLNGSGQLSMPAVSEFRIAVASADQTATIILTDIGTAGVLYIIFRESADGNTHTRVQIETDPTNPDEYNITMVDYINGVSTVLYNYFNSNNSNLLTYSSTGKNLIVSIQGTSITATMGSFTQTRTTGTAAAGNARLTAVGNTTIIDKIEII